MAFFNNPNVTGVEQRAKKTLSGFQTFILRGNVVDLAVGIMIGAAFSSVVTGLVNDVITPLIPVTNTSLQKWAIGPVPWTKASIQIGPFINTIITFLILALVIYFAYQGIVLSEKALIITGTIEILIMVALAFTGLADPGPGGFSLAPLTYGRMCNRCAEEWGTRSAAGENAAYKLRIKEAE